MFINVAVLVIMKLDHNANRIILNNSIVVIILHWSE